MCKKVIEYDELSAWAKRQGVQTVCGRPDGRICIIKAVEKWQEVHTSEKYELSKEIEDRYQKAYNSLMYFENVVEPYLEMERLEELKEQGRESEFYEEMERKYGPD